MEFNNEEFWKDRDQSKQEHEKPKAWRVDDDDDLKEDDPDKELFDEIKPVREDEGMGVKSKFRPSANNKNNTSQKVDEGADNDEMEHIET
ncbi:MAG TPA: hypothetical protein VNX40_08270 [Mucilaginibacter sp.]|jgi:hypothetical protein|nr:hypothetical protein [Mucilaginibacter sp.]